MKKPPPTRKHRLWILGCAAALTALPALAESSYSYPRVLEGPATLTTDGVHESLDLHQPILVGDRIRLTSGSRLEIVLADRSLLRLGGAGEIEFPSIAYSAETEDRSTVLRLDDGEAQLIVPEDALGDALPQLETPDATIYVHRAGSFRITVSPGGWTELVVRDGLAEMVTDRGSLLVHPGEAGWTQSGRQPRLELRLADSRDALERWGDWLSAEAVRADVPYVDPSIRYAARPLAEHGVWVEIDRSWAWRPTVAVDWRPYVHGYWRHTPIGPTWVSYDPWGYVTHHYGSWDLVPGHGWIWYPGVAYAPARVHWYRGPTYVGWCPSGYYFNHYARHRHGSGLGFGFYGWAGGSWHPFRHWSFTLHVDFGHRHRHRHVHDGARLAGHHAGPRLERGIVTTEPPVRRGGRHEAFADLRREVERRERLNGRPLPDVTDFVARKPLTPDLERAVLRPEPAGKPRSATRVLTADGDRRPPRREAVARKDAGRYGAPATVERSRPAVRPAPTPRVTAPRAERSRPSVRPAPPPRVTSPRVSPPRVERSRPSVRPAPPPRVSSPRAERSRPSVRSTPPPRVTPPRVQRSGPSVRSAPPPRVSPPRAQRPKPAVRSTPAPRPDRTVDRNRAQGQTRPKAQAPKRPQPEKKAASRSSSKDSKSRQRDH